MNISRPRSICAKGKQHRNIRSSLSVEICAPSLCQLVGKCKFVRTLGIKNDKFIIFCTVAVIPKWERKQIDWLHLEEKKRIIYKKCRIYSGKTKGDSIPLCLESNPEKFLHVFSCIWNYDNSCQKCDSQIGWHISKVILWIFGLSKNRKGHL